MRRTALVAFALVALLGAGALLLVGASERRTRAFTLGVRPEGVAALLRPGSVACQGPIAVPARFDAVELLPGTFHRPGPALEVRVHRGTALVGRGAVRGGYADNAPQVVPVGAVPARGEISVCVRNAGQRRVALWGGDGAMAPASGAQLDGRGIDPDVLLVFRRQEATSTLGLVPELLERASRFRAGWIGPGVYWALLAGVALGVPGLLALALGAATGRERDGRPR